MSECNCSYHNDICSSCRKAEEEMHQELTALRDWKEKARPFIKDYRTLLRRNYDNDMVIIALTELIKEGE